MANRLFMGVSVLVRMGMGLFVFIVLARALGPRDYGFLTTVIAYASLAGLLSDFGFTFKTLRDIAAEPQQAKSIVEATLRIKALLMAPTLVAGGLAFVVLPIDWSTKIAGALIATGFLVASVGDLSMVAFRALGMFSREAKIVVWTSSIYGVSVSAAAFAHLGIVGIAATIFASRVLYTVVAIASIHRVLPIAPHVAISITDTIRQIRRSLSWAMDTGLSYVSIQIDALLLVHIVGLTSAGIYQSGGRFAQAALGLVAVLSNVHIPAVAATAQARSMNQREKRVLGEFTAFGLACAAFLLAFGPFLTMLLLGPKYAAVDQLWPGFATFVLARYVTAGFGVTLTAFARPRLRVAGQAFGLAVIVTAFWTVLPMIGLTAAPWIMASGSLATLLVYAIGRLRLTAGVQPA